MTIDRRLLSGLVAACLALVASGAWAEETQDSPLYQYTLKTALSRIDGSVAADAVPASAAPESAGNVIIFAQVATTASAIDALNKGAFQYVEKKEGLLLKGTTNPYLAGQRTVLRAIASSLDGHAIAWSFEDQPNFSLTALVHGAPVNATE